MMGGKTKTERSERGGGKEKKRKEKRILVRQDG
jgi:hypothetical protein